MNKEKMRKTNKRYDCCYVKIQKGMADEELEYEWMNENWFFGLSLSLCLTLIFFLMILEIQVKEEQTLTRQMC